MVFKMIIGDRTTFAINFEVKECIDDWVFGHFYIYVRGVIIGDDQDYSVDLKGCLNWLKDLVEKPRDRYEPHLYEMDKEQAFLRLAAPVLVNENRNGFAKEFYENTFSRFHISHIGMSSFDQFILLFVKSSNGLERLIWKNSDDDIFDAYFPAGKVESIIGEAVALIDRQLETVNKSL